MKKSSFVTALMVATAASAVALADAKLKGGYYACLSKDLLDEITDAEVKHDEEHTNWLLHNGCVITKGGLTVYDLGSDGFGVRKVRYIAPDGGAIIFWTNFENLVE